MAGNRGKVYLAARYSRRLELCGYREALEALGWEVTSRWLNGSHQIDNQGVPLGDDGERRFEMGDPALDRWREHFAAEDVADVLAAGTLIAFTEEPRVANSRGGRHVELGIAIAAGKHVVIAGPRENVFCWLPEVEWHPDWAHLFAAWLARETADAMGAPQAETAPASAEVVLEAAAPHLAAEEGRWREGTRAAVRRARQPIEAVVRQELDSYGLDRPAADSAADEILSTVQDCLDDIDQTIPEEDPGE